MNAQRKTALFEARAELREASQQIDGHSHVHHVNPYLARYGGHSQGAERYTPDKQALRALHRAVERLAEAMEADG